MEIYVIIGISCFALFIDTIDVFSYIRLGLKQ